MIYLKREEAEKLVQYLKERKFSIDFDVQDKKAGEHLLTFCGIDYAIEL